MDKKEKKTIDTTITELLELLGIDGTFEVKDAEDGIDVVLDTKDSGLVIGYHGDTLESLQLVISLCIAKKLDRFLRVSIEVGDYKKKPYRMVKKSSPSNKRKGY